LPGGDFPVDGVESQISKLQTAYPFLDDRWAKRMIRAYGTDARLILGAAKSAKDLGRDFGASLTETEINWLMDREFARRAEDVVWRRNKQGLRMTPDQIATLDAWMVKRRQAA